MNTLLKLEGLALFGLLIFLFLQLEYAWWWYPLLFFLPDLSILGYLGGTCTGAVFYNIIHHHANSVGLYGIGFFFVFPPLQLAGVILLGYGLKHADVFQHTHLGVIGKQ